MNKQVGENTAGQEVGEGGKGGDRGKGGKGGKGGKRGEGEKEGERREEIGEEVAPKIVEHILVLFTTKINPTLRAFWYNTIRKYRVLLMAPCIDCLK